MQNTFSSPHPLPYVGNQRLGDLKSEGIEAEAKGRTEQKVAEKNQRNKKWLNWAG